MTKTIDIGSTVRVAHLMGIEPGVVLGIQTDPTTGNVGWYRVQFADKTISTWHVSVCEGV